MRLSMDESDPGYNPYIAIRAKTYLNGIEFNDCITADEELGEVIAFARDGAGLMIGPDDKPVTEIRRGTVKILVAP